MVRCTLSKLMGIHRMNIQDVHEKTGLNRATISKLYNDKATGINYETIEKLCSLFKCNLSDLIDYSEGKE